MVGWGGHRLDGAELISAPLPPSGPRYSGWPGARRDHAGIRSDRARYRSRRTRLTRRVSQRVRQLTLVPFDDGRFEVFVDGKKIYSKKATGRFPEYTEVQTALEKRAG